MTTPNDKNPAMRDDALITAYALGELDDDAHAEERVALEARLADDPALQVQVERIAQLGEQLEVGYADTGEAGLTDEALCALPIGPDATPTLAGPTHAATNNSGPLARLLPYAAVAACAAGATAIGFLALQSSGHHNPAGPNAVATDAPSLTAESDVDPANAQPPAVSEPAPNDAITAALETPVTVDYDAAPLGEVLDDLRNATGVNLVVNWPGTELVGVDESTVISLQLTHVPARLVLDYTLQQASAENFEDDKVGYRIGDRTVEIATLAELKTATVVRVYDINALLGPSESLLAQFESRLVRLAESHWGGGGGGGLFGADDGSAQNFNSTPRFDLNFALDSNAPAPRDADRLNRHRRDALTFTGPGLPGRPDTPRLARAHPAPPPVNSGGSNGGGGLFGDDSAQEDTPSRQEWIDQAVELVQDNIGDRDEWLDEASTIRERNGMLVIKTTPENHTQIAELLALIDAADRPASDIEGLADDPERIEELAALFAHDLEERLVEVREREAQRERIARWRAEFADINDNPFHTADDRPLSTFSVDVDTASYAIARRSLMQSSQAPPPNAIRIEEFVNYFKYDYDAPQVPIDLLDDGVLTTAALERLEARDESFTPFATHVEVADCPWAEGHQLVRVGIKGMEVSYEDRPAAHLTFLLDVSGSMNNADKLPLVKDAMVMLLDQLRDDDQVSIVVYAGGTGSVIEGVPAADYERIREAIDTLQTSGGTNGEAGIKLAYELAERYYVPGGVNRVILCTDGDFNVGVSGTDELVSIIQEKANPAPPADGGVAPAVYLTVFGFGTGNLNDDMMERLTNAGNGNYAYLDSIDEAARALSDQVNGTLVTIAKDVKIQIEFNPAQVAAYRLIGYENRLLNEEDFNDDTVDAGDIGAGHTVTALYEIVPARPGVVASVNTQPAEGDIDELRYQRPRVLTDAAQLAELLMLKLRYKPVDAAATQGTSRRVVLHVPAQSVPFEEASETTRFAAAVACFGMTLRGSPHRGTADLSWIIATADAARQHDPHGYRAEFITVAARTREILEPGEDD